MQFIAGKERTEEEFFHTFNAIHESGGQIVLSSDRPPRAMTILEDRLRSRFEWGLIADIQPPDYETRIAILRSKLAGPIVGAVPSDVIDFIAQKVQSNIRELEGSLNRLLAYARHLQQPVTVELAAQSAARSGGARSVGPRRDAAGDSDRGGALFRRQGRRSEGQGAPQADRRAAPDRDVSACARTATCRRPRSGGCSIAITPPCCTA